MSTKDKILEEALTLFQRTVTTERALSKLRNKSESKRPRSTSISMARRIF